MQASRDDSERSTSTLGRRQGWFSRLMRDVLFVVQRERKWWLLPLILLVLMLAALLIFAAAAGPLAPFIYPLL
jgi:hypothetical protein